MKLQTEQQFAIAVDINEPQSSYFGVELLLKTFNDTKSLTVHTKT